MMTVESNCKPIADGVLPIDTWSPNNGVQAFEYIDISSVDRVAKRIANTTNLRAEDAPSRARQIVRTGDVLVSTVRPNLNAVALVPSTLDQAIASTGYTVLRCHPKRLDNRYLFYWVQSPAFIDSMVKQATGASYPAVSDRIVKSSEIPLPPLAEQRRIADILDKADTIRRKRREALNNLEAIPKHAFEEVFVAGRSDKWEVGTIRDLVESVNYGTSAKAGSVGEFPILRMNNITYGGCWDFSDLKYIDLADRDKEKYLARSGDLLFNRTNSRELVGKTAVYREDVPMAFAGYLVRVRTNSRAVPDYIAGFLNSPHGKATLQHMCKSIIGMANINAQELQDISIPIPPKTLQQDYSKVVAFVRSREQHMTNAVQQADDLFGALVFRSFQGKL